MNTNTIMIFCNFILIVLATVVLHEMIHLITAFFFHRSPKIHFEYYVIPNVCYANNNNYLQTLTISLLPSVILTIIGFLLQGDSIYIIFGKIILGLNIFNFFPITTDGEVALYAIIKLMKDEK